MTALDVLALLDDRPRDAVSVLGLLPEEEADAQPLARGVARGARRRGRPAKPSTPVAGDVLALLFPKRKRYDKKRALRYVSRHFQSGAVSKQSQLRALRHNRSGHAVTQDQLFPVLPIPKVQRVPGKVQWKKYTPEAIQRAAFSKGTLRQIAASVGAKHRSQCRSLATARLL